MTFHDDEVPITRGPARPETPPWVPRNVMGEPVFDPQHLAALVEETTTTISPLQVNVDWIELLEHHMGDEAAAFATLGKLKDLLA